MQSQQLARQQRNATPQQESVGVLKNHGFLFVMHYWQLMVLKSSRVPYLWAEVDTDRHG
jgi:hypothetical protein